MSAFVHRLRVRYAECDMQGHVFNAHYLTWMDVAFTELWRAHVGAYADFSAAGFETVVAETGLRFRGSARFDEEIDIAVTVDPPTTSSVTSCYVMTRGADVLLEAWLRHVCVEAAGYAKAPWPAATARRLVAAASG